RVLVFPTSMGSCYEWGDRHMHEVLGDHLANGWIQLFCLDHVHDESWYNKGLHPGAQAWRHLQYDHYVLTEVLPFTESVNANPFVITLARASGRTTPPASASGTPSGSIASTGWRACTT